MSVFELCIIVLVCAVKFYYKREKKTNYSCLFFNERLLFMSVIIEEAGLNLISSAVKNSDFLHEKKRKIR